jgi:hypothetical protein
MKQKLVSAVFLKIRWLQPTDPYDQLNPDSNPLIQMLKII